MIVRDMVFVFQFHSLSLVCEGTCESVREALVVHTKLCGSFLTILYHASYRTPIRMRAIDSYNIKPV